MRHFLIPILFIIVAATSFAQDINPYTLEPHYDKYYPENKIIKKSRIKYIIDNSEFILPRKFNIKLYDTSGRIIGDINRSVDSFHTPFVYRKTADTLFRLKYYTDRTELYCFERFIYNKKEQIVSYLECCNYYFQKDNYYVSYEEFYYDEKNLLTTKLTYSRNNYPGIVSDKNNIRPADLELTDVIYYTYKTLGKGNKLIIGKHASGKPEWRETDSTIFDKQNRVTRFSSFAKKGAMGEQVQNNVNRVTEYSYTDTSLTITGYTIYCMAQLSDFECFQYSQTDKDITLIIYNRDKTKKAEYGFYINGERYLRDKYEYFYY